MLKFLKIALLLSVLLSLLESNALADARWKRCIRMSFPGNNQGTMTNLCNKYLYVTWYDDRGEHTTAIGANVSSGLGKIHGRFQIHDAYPQSDVGDNSDKGSGQSSNSRRETSSAKSQQCEERRAHNYRSADIVEGSDPALAASFRSSADSAYSSCVRGGDFSSAYHAALNGRGRGPRSSSQVSRASKRSNGGIALERGEIVGPPCGINPSGLHVCLNDALGEGGKSYPSKDGYEVYVVDHSMWKHQQFR